MKSWLFLAGLLAWSSVLTASPLARLNGAWRPAGETEGETVLLIQDGYWSHAAFDLATQTFARTFGGPFVLEDDEARGTFHFDSAAPERVGTEWQARVVLADDRLTLQYATGRSEEWMRIASATDPLAGVWRITGRERSGQVLPMPLRARRTLKILTGGRFQWIAMNIETGEFSGTGGGTYTFENGAYTERIEFFSRDGSRVGATLTFQGEVRDGEWHHRGLSSRGDPIYEIWSHLEAATR